MIPSVTSVTRGALGCASEAFRLLGRVRIVGRIASSQGSGTALDRMAAYASA